jgi:hypothetical protein
MSYDSLVVNNVMLVMLVHLVVIVFGGAQLKGMKGVCERL